MLNTACRVTSTQHGCATTERQVWQKQVTRMHAYVLPHSRIYWSYATTATRHTAAGQVDEVCNADLVPPEVARKWLVYLREELPAVAFKAATKKKGAIKQIRSSQPSMPGATLETSECLGADTLMQLLKNYSRSNDVKSVISVGVVGLPNVGKSSVINSLKRSNVACTGNAPGITRTVQEVHLDKHIRLLDSPGLVTATAQNPAAEALYGGVKVSALPCCFAFAVQSFAPSSLHAMLYVSARTWVECCVMHGMLACRLSK
jgi:hypothetical protein